MKGISREKQNFSKPEGEALSFSWSERHFPDPAMTRISPTFCAGDESVCQIEDSGVSVLDLFQNQ